MASPRESRAWYSKVGLHAPLHETSGTTAAAQRKRKLFFEPGGWANGPLTVKTPDAASPGYVTGLSNQAYIPSGGGTNFNYATFSRPVYFARHDTPRIKVTDYNDGYLNQADSPYKWGPTEDWPWEPGWRAADAEIVGNGRDQHMVTVDPNRDELWEAWLTLHDPPPTSNPHGYPTNVRANHGGKAPNLSTFSGAWPTPFGASGTSISVLAGLIRLEEVQAGLIPHAVSFACRVGTAAFMAPATRSDQSGGTYAIPEGAIFTFPDAYDIEAYCDTHEGSILTRLVMRAIKTYGAICMDASGAVTIYGEDLRDQTTGLQNNTPWNPFKVGPKFAMTGVAATNIITATGHNFSNNTPVVLFTPTGGAGLVDGSASGQFYYVVGQSGQTFQLAATSGGAAIDFTTDITAGTVGKIQQDWELFYHGNRFPWWELIMLPAYTGAGRSASTFNTLTGTHSGAVTAGATSIVPGTAGRSVDYAGGKTTFAHDAAFNVGATCTIRVGVKPRTVPASGTRRTLLNRPGAYSLKMNGAMLEGNIVIGGVTKTVSATNYFVVGTQVDVAMTYDGVSLQVFKNGVTAGSLTDTGSVDSVTADITIGSLADGTEAFDGHLQLVDVLAEPLTAGRLAADVDNDVPTDPPPPIPAKLDTLVDNFNDNSINTAKWSVSTPSGPQITEANGTLIIPTTGGYPTLSSVDAYDFTASKFSLQVVSQPTGASFDQCGPLVRSTVNPIAQIQFIYADPVPVRLRAQYMNTAGAWIDVAVAVHDATAHRWRRMREAGGTVFWEVSSDGEAWNAFASIVWTTTGWPISHLQYTRAYVFAGNWGSEPSRPDFVIDDVNLLPSVASPDDPPAVDLPTLLTIRAGVTSLALQSHETEVSLDG